MSLKTIHNKTYNLTSHVIPKGKVRRKNTRKVVWEETENGGRPVIAVVCINRACLAINIIDKSEVKADGFVDRGRWAGDYDKSCISCKCGVCYWPYLTGWKKSAKKASKN